MEVIGPSNEDEMVACFLRGELSSPRFGDGVRAALADLGLDERRLTDPDLSAPAENAARRKVLAQTRGYGENGDVFEDFPADVTVFDVPNDRFQAAAAAIRRGEQLPPLILAGVAASDLVCHRPRLRFRA